MTTYKKIANAIAHSQRVTSNADMFDSRGDSWTPSHREREEEYSESNFVFCEPIPRPKVDKRKFNAEKRARAKFNKQGARAGVTRDNEKLKLALARHHALTTSNSLRSVIEKGPTTQKTTNDYIPHGHFVLDKRAIDPNIQKKKLEKHAAVMERINKWL